MRKRSYRVAAGLAVLALLTAGCSSDNAAEDTAATEGTVAVDPQLEIFTWWSSGGEAEGLAGMESVFKANNPDTEYVNASIAGGAGVNAKAVLTSRLEADDPPDSFQAHAGMELDGYVKSGKLEDLTDLYK